MQGVGDHPGLHHRELQVALLGRAGVDGEGGLPHAEDAQLAHLAGLEGEALHDGQIVEAMRKDLTFGVSWMISVTVAICGRYGLPARLPAWAMGAPASTSAEVSRVLPAASGAPCSRVCSGAPSRPPLHPLPRRPGEAMVRSTSRMSMRVGQCMMQRPQPEHSRLSYFSG